MTLYGFKKDDATRLKRMSRREGLRARNQAKVRYPRPLPDDVPRSGWGRITGTLSALGSQTCRIWKDVAGTMTDTGEDITVYDRLLASGDTLTTKWRVRWQQEGERYYVINAACQADTSAVTWGT